MLIAVLAFTVFMIIGVPIAFVLGIMGSIHTISLGNSTYLLVIIQRLYDQINYSSLTCLPFFILAGDIMNAGGVTKRLLNFIRELIGWLKGGMAYATVIISAILSAILGSPNAVCSMLCGVLVPELRKDGYDDEFTGSLVAASSILGPIIPPSTSFIMFCMLTSTSINAMFMAGVLPGILLALMFCLLVTVFARKRGYTKSIDRPSIKRLVKAFIAALPAMLVPVVIMGGVVGGIFTATEAGAVSCVCAIIASMIYKSMDWKNLPKVLLKSAIVGGGILLMISFGGVIAWSMTRSGIPKLLIAAITSITTSRALITALILIILLIGGMFLDNGTLAMVLLPVLFPLGQAIGFDPVHFGIFWSCMLTIGYITPPVGVLLFVTSNIAQIPFNKLCKQIWPFVLGAVIVIGTIAFLPEDIVLWLPRLTGYAG